MAASQRRAAEEVEAIADAQSLRRRLVADKALRSISPCALPAVLSIPTRPPTSCWPPRVASHEAAAGALTGRRHPVGPRGLNPSLRSSEASRQRRILSQLGAVQPWQASPNPRHRFRRREMTCPDCPHSLAGAVSQVGTVRSSQLWGPRTSLDASSQGRMGSPRRRCCSALASDHAGYAGVRLQASGISLSQESSTAGGVATTIRGPNSGAPHAGDDGVVSHGTAAALLGLTPMPLPTEVLHASVPHGRRRRPTPGLVVHQRRVQRAVLELAGLPVTGPMGTIVDIAGNASPQ